MLHSGIGVSTERKAPPGDILRPRRRRGLLLGGVALLVAGLAGGMYVLRGVESPPPPSGPALPTAPVVRTDMVDVRDVDGTLGYAGDFTVLGGGGRITWLPDPGDVIRRGERVYGVDGHAVPLFYGATPFWRDLRQGMSGRDVLQLERNLDALGYGDDMTVDRAFTWATARAVMDWQDDLNVPRTGVLGMDAAVVQPGPLRVTELNAVPGARADGVILTAGGTERVVTVHLPVNDQDIAGKGAAVRITLPGERTATGRITSVGSVATAGATNARSQTGEGTENATIPVHITLDRSSSAGGLDGAPVTVGFSSTVHEKVLAVPINALLASAEGDYSVKVVDSAGATRSVPVELGIFDGDRVEVRGALTPGMNVQVPRS
ncbi:peptidoglycan-binding protein [Microtetraspora sp. NBRC 13810]|nr:peptidoglycan-binding protein [Microtetraspora sp. NBRC 13810]